MPGLNVERLYRTGSTVRAGFVDQSLIDALPLVSDRVVDAAEQAWVSAIKVTLPTYEQRIIKELSTASGVPVKFIRPRVKVKTGGSGGARSGSLSTGKFQALASIWIGTFRIPMITALGLQGSRSGSGIGRKNLFVAHMKNGHKGVFQRRYNKGTKVRAIRKNLYGGSKRRGKTDERFKARKTYGRLPIQELNHWLNADAESALQEVVTSGDFYAEVSRQFKYELEKLI